jgi:hypothetical protein
VRPPHYDTFAEFHYSYHYGDSYIPHLQQEEPLNWPVGTLLIVSRRIRIRLPFGRHGRDD